jgi:hypothetical protein
MNSFAPEDSENAWLTMTADDRFELRSNEAGAFLAIQRDAPERRQDNLQEDYWIATLSCGSLQASLRFYEISIARLASYWAELAANWRGWTGERRWASLEGDVELVASHDGLGTITLTAQLGTEAFAVHRWTASAELLLDAGGLERIAREARRLF